MISKRGYYRHWSKPVRVDMPSEDELHDRALATFKKVYSKGQSELKEQGHLTGPEAILAVAATATREGLSDDEVYNLAGFSLPLGAKRALDYSTFFEGRNKTVAESKYDMAKLFGSAQSKLMAREFAGFADDLEQLAKLESRVEHSLT